MEITYEKAKIEDAALLVSLYNAAFYDDFVRFGACPGYGRSARQMEQSIEKYPKYIIFADGAPAGVISAAKTADGVCEIGCLAVIPSHQHRGIGTAAMAYFIANHPFFREIHLVTPAEKAENIAFYTQKCGFRVVGEEYDGSVRLSRLRYLREEKA